MSDKYELSFTIKKTKDNFEGTWEASCPSLHEAVEDAIKRRLNGGDYSEGLRLDDVLLLTDDGHEVKDQSQHGTYVCHFR